MTYRGAIAMFTTAETRRAASLALACLALTLSGGCGGDSAAPGAPTPTTPAPAPPAPAPTPAPDPAPTCQVGMVLRPGESCTYPGTSNVLTINPDGTASFLSSTVGSSINIRSSNISLQATRQSDGSWRIERVGSSSAGTGAGTPNRAPRAVGSIPDQTLTEDGNATTVDVSARFTDPDGDGLSYRATSSRTSVVRVSVSGSRMTLTPGDAGTATVTVTATDSDGLTATQRFDVTVESAPTRPGGACAAGLLLRPGESCTYPGTSDRFMVNADGSATFLFFTSSRSISVVNSSINGRVYTLVATRQSDGRWRIERVGNDSTPSGGDSCSIESLGTLRTVPLTRSASLGRDCVSPNFTGELARYYSFRIAERAEVQIDLTSSAFDAWLVLREGSDISGRSLANNDDGGPGTDARIVRTLAAGAYTIEATSLRPDRTGAFTLRVARTGGSGEPAGDAVVSAGDLECSVREQVAGTGLVNGTISGRLRAVRSVGSVTATGIFTERDGDRRTHSLIPDFLGGMEAGETKTFSSTGVFTTSASRFGCSANIEWIETRQGAQGSIRMDAVHSVSKSPPS